ncbi:TPA: thiamine phosphate synthase [Acinetobacter baumannii]|jgi:thiamine-phosphate pyrophosphorylase|uniref:Thiamine-phosphate synthase n=26 Tax=Gammaproteobacteria TaxID=1236 RepID=A0A1L2ZV43_ACIBA|nr:MULTISPECIES: thiamine phosphate synthase [Acinetobacter]ADX93341.1 thiamine monophosphate synthase [Acinetobacter baumannii TCDC-AB0715]AHX27518.1 thiamine-phosphate pyrophosphorylase [Acinetobacter baumannii AC12]AHX63880.1 thiamine-phosphate pyrophosphorylase [Acinetobacter baumannii AC30]EMT86135.1 thiamine monophosphate synthase [Acinetobacter baumannii ABNIH5]ETY68472.1 thiamin-phosphate pyrophosphorylase [Acinetobacter baumannii MDR_MMC4]EXB14831.1 thiamine-phosphate pyrophosphoryla
MRGLYLITNDDPIQLLLEKLDAALATRQIAILQYRRKKIDKAEQPAEVEQIKQLCEKYQVPFVINDDLKLAAQFGLGVHLGQSDGEITDAKSQLPEGVIIGRTCLNSLELAQKAIADGATYVAFGAVYATATKPEAGNVGIEVIKQAAAQYDLPICAIGGLTVENSKPVIEAGADLCAVISDILGRSTAEIPARVQAWAQLFS